MVINFFKRLTYRLSRQWCYDQMEQKGSAVFGCCNGMFGGGPETEWLSYSCMDCPYWTPTGIKTTGRQEDD